MNKNIKPRSDISPTLERGRGDPRSRSTVQQGVTDSDLAAPLKTNAQGRVALSTDANGPLVVRHTGGLDLNVGDGIAVKKGSPPRLVALGSDSVVVDAKGIHSRPRASQVRDDSGVGSGSVADTFKNRVELLERRGVANGYVPTDSRNRIPAAYGGVSQGVPQLDDDVQVPGVQLGGASFGGATTKVLRDSSPPTWGALPAAALPAHATTHNTGGSDPITALAGSVITTVVTGTGNVVKALSPTLSTPDIGTPSAGTLTNCLGLPVAGIAAMPLKTLIANTTAGAAVPTAHAVTDVLDLVGSTKGDILVRDTAIWARLAGGTSGYPLVANGAGALPSYRAIDWGGIGYTNAVVSHLDSLTLESTSLAASATLFVYTLVTGWQVTITGNTGITALETAPAGTMRLLTFTGTPTITHNATSLILPGGANITAAAGDKAIFLSHGAGNWECWVYVRQAQAPPTAANTGTGGAVLSTSPTITSAALVTPALGTPASGVLSACTDYPKAISTSPSLITSTATVTFTTGAHTNWIAANLIGAGGGGGGAAQAATSASAGGGAAAGGRCFTGLIAVSPSTAYTIAIGAGGTAGANTGTDGGTGGTTSLTVGATTYTAVGGIGGKGMAATVTFATAAGGSGGSATNGLINQMGGPGGYAIAMVVGGVTTFANSGHGGTSFLGGGAVGFNTERAGAASGNYGGGGSGGCCLGTTGRAGGAGKDGAIEFWEYS